jgi:hypothetical protein
MLIWQSRPKIQTLAPTAIDFHLKVWALAFSKATLSHTDSALFADPRKLRTQKQLLEEKPKHEQTRTTSESCERKRIARANSGKRQDRSTRRLIVARNLTQNTRRAPKEKKQNAPGGPLPTDRRVARKHTTS